MPMLAAQRKARVVAIAMLGAHVICLGALVTGVSPAAFLIAALAYLIRAFGVTAGYHRLLAHGAFRAGRVMQFVLAGCGALATQGGPLWWVSHHRTHHRYTETEKDIHSPKQRGFWYSHIGWMMDKESFSGTATNVKDLHRFPEIKALQRVYPGIVAGQIAFFCLLGFWLQRQYPQLGTSTAQVLVWGYFVSTVALWHATFMVNSVCHIWGRRSYQGDDHSTNNWLVALLTLGEGWHNNHHQFAYSARHGLRWWQVDCTWLLLRGMELIGLVQELKLPRRVAGAAPA
jgi:stearoyl-CoA desaturase (delta-9 desaturase)